MISLIALCLVKVQDVTRFEVQVMNCEKSVPVVIATKFVKVPAWSGGGRTLHTPSKGKLSGYICSISSNTKPSVEARIRATLKRLKDTKVPPDSQIIENKLWFGLRKDSFENGKYFSDYQLYHENLNLQLSASSRSVKGIGEARKLAVIAYSDSSLVKD